MIPVKEFLQLKVLKKVFVKDKNWNMPGSGTLNPGTILTVDGTPTRISDVSFRVISGSGIITKRTPTRDITSQIVPGTSLFFSEGHNTSHPYDFGTLDPEYFQKI